MSRDQLRKPAPAAGRHVEAAIIDYLREAAGSRSVRQAHLLGTAAVARLEAKLRHHYGKRHALCVTNATSGLLALAVALDLGGCDVIVPPLAWGGTLAGLLQVGGRPVFADVDRHTLGLCPESARRVLTPRTKAMLALDLFGVPADHSALRRIADEHGLWYIHDAAQSFGATLDDHPAGAAAHAVVVSFSSGKTLFAGEGGAVLMDDDDLYERLVWITQHPYRHRRELGLAMANEFALNLRIHPLAAVWADADFQAALERLAVRCRMADEMVLRLDESGLTEPLDYVSSKASPTYLRITAAWSGEAQPDRLQQVMLEAGMNASIMPLDLGLVYRDNAFRAQYRVSRRPSCPVAEDQIRRRFEILPESVGKHRFRSTDRQATSTEPGKA